MIPEPGHAGRQVNAAPRLIDFLGEASLRHFDTVKGHLDANGVA